LDENQHMPNIRGSTDRNLGSVGAAHCPAGTNANSIFKKLSTTCVRDLAARSARAVHLSLAPENKGRGECRMPAAPAASCALCIVRTHTSNNEHTGITRHSRTQWF
jgi:hypothetical protein